MVEPRFKFKSPYVKPLDFSPLLLLLASVSFRRFNEMFDPAAYLAKSNFSQKKIKTMPQTVIQDIHRKGFQHN
jgi:hypothetical protein